MICSCNQLEGCHIVRQRTFIHFQVYEWDRHLLQGSNHRFVRTPHFLLLAKAKVIRRLQPLIALTQDKRERCYFPIALWLCYFHPQTSIPDAKVTIMIITHLSFSKEFWRMQWIPSQEMTFQGQAEQNALKSILWLLVHIRCCFPYLNPTSKNCT